mmetsp:Transcript_2886/g.4191  ORF Transcript_2886/g.4191 Transcript_2886/m.4191 type:complete len:498 (-) Transcript_2886:956-2449(-)
MKMPTTSTSTAVDNEASAKGNSVPSMKRMPTSTSSSSAFVNFSSYSEPEAPKKGIDNSSFEDASSSGISLKEGLGKNKENKQVVTPDKQCANQQGTRRVVTQDHGHSVETVASTTFSDDDEQGFSEKKSNSRRRKSSDLKENQQGEQDHDSPCTPLKKVRLCKNEEIDGKNKKQEVSALGSRPSLGRRGDPRMHKAVAARLISPELTAFQALVIGGFRFPECPDEESTKFVQGSIYDTDKVLLSQRKNQLCRRLRQIRRRNEKREAKEQESGPYFQDTNQFLGGHLEPFIHKDIMNVNAPVDSYASEVAYTGSTSNNNNLPFLAHVSTPPGTAHQLVPVPEFCFSLPNQQVNAYQQQQRMQLLKDLNLQEQKRLCFSNSAAVQQPFSYNGFEPSLNGSAFRPFNMNFTPVLGSSSPAASEQKFDCANDILLKYPRYRQSIMDHALASFPLPPSFCNQQQEDLKRRALISAGFSETQIDESLLGAIDSLLGRNNSLPR